MARPLAPWYHGGFGGSYDGSVVNAASYTTWCRATFIDGVRALDSLVCSSCSAADGHTIFFADGSFVSTFDALPGIHPGSGAAPFLMCSACRMAECVACGERRDASMSASPSAAASVHAQVCPLSAAYATALAIESLRRVALDLPPLDSYEKLVDDSVTAVKDTDSSAEGENGEAGARTRTRTRAGATGGGEG